MFRNESYISLGRRLVESDLRRRKFALTEPLSPPERQRLIDEAIASGRVTKCPTAQHFRTWHYHKNQHFLVGQGIVSVKYSD